MSLIPRVLAVTGPALIVAAALAMPPPVYADPPPWAPAHGYRAKGKGKVTHKNKHQAERYEPAPSIPFDLDLGRCNRELLGQVLGGAAGAAVGSTVRGDSRPVAIVAGAIAGVLIGGAIGRHMDEVDHHCVGQALEYAETGKSVTWQNPDKDARYRLTPMEPTRTSSGQYCREYRTVATIGSRREETRGTACRSSDGTWRIANPR